MELVAVIILALFVVGSLTLIDKIKDLQEALTRESTPQTWLDRLSAVDLATIQTDDELFAQVLKICADKLMSWRESHNGYVPRPLFEDALKCSASYPCMELLPRTPDGRFWLKARRAGEQGWEGLFQIPGQSLRVTDMSGSIMGRLSEEVFGDGEYDRIADFPVSLATVTMVREPERGGVEVGGAKQGGMMCLTPVFIVKIETELQLSQDAVWMPTTELEPNQVVQQHLGTLRVIGGKPGLKYFAQSDLDWFQTQPVGG